MIPSVYLVGIQELNFLKKIHWGMVFWSTMVSHIFLLWCEKVSLFGFKLLYLIMSYHILYHIYMLTSPIPHQRPYYVCYIYGTMYVYFDHLASILALQPTIISVQNHTVIANFKRAKKSWVVIIYLNLLWAKVGEIFTMSHEAMC
jgi:hypothetical protein